MMGSGRGGVGGCDDCDRIRDAAHEKTDLG